MIVAGSTSNEVGLESLIRGHKANLYLGDSRKVTLRPERAFGEEIEERVIQGDDNKMDSQDQLRLQWLQSIRTRQQPVSTIDLGAYIATEATLSYLGIGLQAPTISWGLAISNASGIGFIRSAPHMLLFPSLFLSLTVLAFIMLGEVIRDALDPKLR